MDVISEEDLTRLRAFVGVLQESPGILHSPELSFLKEMLIFLGAEIPGDDEPRCSPDSDPPTRIVTSEKRVRVNRRYPGKRSLLRSKRATKKEPSAKESHLEPRGFDMPTRLAPEIEQRLGIDTSGVMEPDEDLCLETGTGRRPAKRTATVSRRVVELMEEAREATLREEFEGALGFLTQGILKDNRRAILFARRSQVLLRMKLPLNAIKDATRALQLNPDQPVAYRVRGIALRMLGHWEAAAEDLSTALSIEFDEEAASNLEEISPIVQKIREYNLSEARRACVDLETPKQETAESRNEKPAIFRESQPSAFSDYVRILQNNPELLSLAENPDVFWALHEIFENKADIRRYGDDPKLIRFLELMAEELN